MTNFKKVILTTFYIISGVAGAQQVIRVPAEVSSIQQAIISATPGSIIDVAPGKYYENIDFLGKAVTIEGVGSKDQVIIDGGFHGPVVHFGSGEGRNSVLQNMTIQHGSPANLSDRTTVTAGGVLINNSAPTLNQLVVTNNMECGIGSFSSSPLIRNSSVQNTSHNEMAYGCPVNNVEKEFFPQAQGAGVFIYGHAVDGSQTEITGNIVANNVATVYSPAGIAVINAGEILINNNYIHDNITQGEGGGIGIQGNSTGLIAQNVIVFNTVNATQVVNPAVQDAGAGINVETTLTSPIYITNNTVAHNHDVGGLLRGTQAYIGPTSNTVLSNNLIIGDDQLIPFQCEPPSPTSTSPMIVLDHNDVYASSNASGYRGNCAIDEDMGDNISVDPMFVGLNNFELSVNSPAIDTGNNAAAGVEATDFSGAVRVQNATGASTAVIDRGAYEHAGIQALPPSPSFSLAVKPASIDLSEVSSTTVMITLTPNNTFQAQISLTCTGLPATITCVFNPEIVNVANGLPQTATLTIARIATTVAWSASSKTMGGAASFALCGCMVIVWQKRRSRHSVVLGFITASVILSLSACGVYRNQQVQQATVSVTAVASTGQKQNVAISVRAPLR